MTITIHLVRHAQGFHNISQINHQIPDPYLTPIGKEQCATLCANFPHHDRITHLVASPMRRTLLTCHLSFQPAVDAGNTIIALPQMQEVSTAPCDTGSEPEVLKAEFGTWADFGLVKKGWNDKTSPDSPWAPRVAALEERARQARVWLRELGRRWKEEGKGENAQIVVVTHGAFLHFLNEDWDGMDFIKGTAWDNTEYRSYEFDDPEGVDLAASIHETKLSWVRRRGDAIPLTSVEQQKQRAVIVAGYRKIFEGVNGQATE